VGSGAPSLPLLTASGTGEVIHVAPPPSSGGGFVGSSDRDKAKKWLTKKTHFGSGHAVLPLLEAYAEGIAWPQLEIISLVPDERILRPPLKFKPQAKALEVPQEPAIDYDAIRAAALAEMKRKRRKRDEEILLLL
jgi:hypothetical protein